MRKLLTLLTVGLTALSFTSQAQFTGGKVKGTVIDGSAKTIESATITLLRVKDSSVAKITAADKTRKFEFDIVPEGTNTSGKISGRGNRYREKAIDRTKDRPYYS